MAYAPVYVTRADVEAEMGPELVSALNDSKQVPPAEQDGLWDKLAEAVDAKVSAAVAMIGRLGRATPPLAFLREYACVTMCSLLYRRRGLVGERNPYDAREKELNDQLDAIADGKTYSGSFAHLAINDAESNVFMEDTDASASSSSGGGGGGGGGGGTAGVSSINGADGAIRIVGGENASVSTLGQVVTVNGADPGVKTLEGLTGDVRLVGGANIDVTQSGNTLTINGAAGGVQSINAATGNISIAAGSGIGVSTDGTTISIGNTQTQTTVNGKGGAVALTAGSGISITDTQGGNGVTIANTIDPVAAVEAADLSTLTLNGSTITEWPQGGGAETARIITTATATVEDGDGLILMDTATAGQAQTLTLPASLETDAATVTVRQLGDYGVTIAHGANAYRLTYAGDWVTLDWISGKGWFWRA